MKMMLSLEETKMENGNGNGNGLATEKQVAALKSLAKNPALSQGLLKGVEFGSLGKKEASDLLGKCFAVADNAGFVNGDFRLRYGQNFKNGNGTFKTGFLTEQELEAVRIAHTEHCIGVLKDCQGAYPADKELQLAMFEKRADKIFTWVQQALDEKIRMLRT